MAGDGPPTPILWRCDRCGEFQVLKDGDDTSPYHKGCGGRWCVSPLLKGSPVIDWNAAS